MWAKAATRSPKNVTPKLDTSKLNPSSAAVAAACCQSTCRCRRPRRAPVPQPTSARRCPAPPRGRRDPRSVRLRRSATRLPSPHRHRTAGRRRGSTTSDLDLDIATGRGLEEAVVQFDPSWLRGQPAEVGAAAIESVREALAALLDGASVRLPGPIWLVSSSARAGASIRKPKQ